MSGRCRVSSEISLRSGGERPSLISLLTTLPGPRPCCGTRKIPVEDLIFNFETMLNVLGEELPGPRISPRWNTLSRVFVSFSYPLTSHLP